MAHQQTPQRRAAARRKARQAALLRQARQLGIKGIDRMAVIIGPDGRSHAPDTAWRLIRQFVERALSHGHRA